MKQKLFTLFFALVASVGTMFAESGKCGDNLTWDLTDGVLIISGSGAMTNWDGYEDVPWYSYRTSIKSVTIGINVTSIGDYAFWNCHGLTSITIPNGITSIGSDAFLSCISLSSVTIGNGVTNIGERAFWGCTGLTSVTIPNSVTSLGEQAFDYCTGLTSVTIGNSVTSIGSGAFQQCTGLTSVTIGNSVTSIGNYAFYDCTSLTSVTIGNSVTSIGNNAFYGCTGLTSVTIPNSVTSIGMGAFGGCTGLTSIIVANDNANYCSADGILFDKDKTELIQYPAGKAGVEYTIPYGVGRIGYRTFGDCQALTSITIPNSVGVIGASAFDSCTGLTSITCVSIVPPYIFDGELATFYNVNKSIPLHVPAGSIAAYQEATGWREFTNIQAIENCIIASGTCGDNLTWELSCDSVLTISGAGAMEDFSSTSDIPWYTINEYKYIKSIIIKDGVTSIGEAAFFECTNLISITIPNSVTSIGGSAFSVCSSLTSVTIPNSVTSIGEQAFDYCRGLTSITIGSGVTSIGASAFASCSGLTSVTIPNSVISIGEKAFYYCKGLTSITIGSGVTSIGASAFSVCSSLTSVTIPNSVISIGEKAFYYCKGLTSITIGSGVTSIGEKAFQACENLTSVYLNSKTIESKTYSNSSSINSIFGSQVTEYILGDSVISIGEEAFEYCKGLTSITIPNSVKSIGWLAFAGCSGLTSIVVENGNTKYDSRGNCNAIIETATNTLICGCQNTIIPINVTGIDDGAFDGRTSLTSITIPNSVTSIGNYAFADCEGLTSIEIPNSVTSIERSAFEGCSGLTSITCEAVNPPVCGEEVFLYVDKSIPLYVPANSVNDYKKAYIWKEFTNIQAIGGEDSCILASGTCGADGDNLTWELSCDSVLTISGIGAMKDWYEEEKPWDRNNKSIFSVVIKDGVTSIGNEAFWGSTSLTSVTIPNSVTSIGDYAFASCEVLTSITIPNSVTSIGEAAFFECTNLISITIPNSVISIGAYAFSQCSSLTSITCAAVNPPVCGADVFLYVDKSIPLYVPAESVAAYITADQWKEFTNILPNSAEEKEVDVVEVVTTENTASIAWPQIDGVYTYELVIKDQNGNVICTLTFNAEGQLTSIKFGAPAQDGAPQHTQAAGFAFTVTGLEAGTTYDYTIVAKDEAGAVLNTETGSFTTLGGEQAIDNANANANANAVKLLRNGQVLIQKGDKTFDLRGHEVR